MQKLMREMENWRQSMIKAAGIPEFIQLREGTGPYAPQEPYSTDLSVPEEDTYDTDLTVPSYVSDTDTPVPPPDFETTLLPLSAPTPVGTSDLSFVGNPAETAQITNPAFGPNLPSDTTGPVPVPKAPASGGQFTQYGRVAQYDSEGNMLGYKNPVTGEMTPPDPGDTTLSTPTPRKSTVRPETISKPKGGGGHKRSPGRAEYQQGSDALQRDTADMLDNLPVYARPLPTSNAELSQEQADAITKDFNEFQAAGGDPGSVPYPLHNPTNWRSIGAGSAIGAGAGGLIGGGLGYALGGKDRKLSSTLLGAGLGIGSGALLGGLGGAYYGNRQS